MGIKITNKKEVFNFCKPYIIAELGSNHNGDMDLAKKLIIQAKEAGADCVKFQSWSKNTMFSAEKFRDNYFLADDYRNRDDYTLEEIVDKYAITEDQLLNMKEFADEVGIDCTSTPFSKKEADFLVDKMDSPFIKVASMDLNNYPFLKYLAEKQRPIVLSTGLSELHEIDKAVKTIESAGNNQIVILHCVSTYPPLDENVNLRHIKTLMKIYPDYPIGFSDHTLGVTIPLAAVALGACVLEKHFTLNKEMEGWDHKVSADAHDLRVIVRDAGRVSMALGQYRISAPESEDVKKEFRRSIVLTENLKTGQKIQKRHIDFKRPGTGIAPGMMDFVIGRTLNKDVEVDHVLTLDDLG